MGDGEVIVLYGPRDGKSLLRTYPELKEEPELKGLSRDDIYFAWLVGIDGSPINTKMNDEARYAAAAAQAYKLISNKEKKAEHSSWHTMPDEVKAAIRCFQKFNPDLRLKAKNMVRNIFENYEKMVSINPEEDFVITKKITKGKGKDAVVEFVEEVDWAGRKSYIDSVANISKNLPEILKQLEDGFGISEKKNDSEASVKAIDIYHQNLSK